MGEMRRRYLPEGSEPPPMKEQKLGAPRPSYGTVCVTYPGPTWRGHPGTWSASWFDEYPEPNENGEEAGNTAIDGDRETVLAWARAQPAVSHLLQSKEGWIPLPEDDDDIVPPEPRVLPPLQPPQPGDADGQP